MEKTFVSNRLRPLIKLSSGRLFSLSLILFSLIICSAVQFFFPLHILTHEFTQFFTIAAFIFFYFVLFRTVKGKGIHQPQCDESLEALKFHAFKGIILLVLITIGLMYLYNKLFWNCHYHPGIPFFLITVVGSLYLASVVGIIGG